MTRRQRARLTGRELAVWSCVFAAAWTKSFQACSYQHGFDYASENEFAEDACTTADAAVYQLRAWERKGCT